MGLRTKGGKGGRGAAGAVWVMERPMRDSGIPP